MPAAGHVTLQRGLTRTTGQRASVPFRVRRSWRLRRRGLEASSLLVRELESANGHKPTVADVCLRGSSRSGLHRSFEKVVQIDARGRDGLSISAEVRHHHKCVALVVDRSSAI